MYKNGERMMAWIAKIDAVEKHPNADSLDICTIGGWKCVTKLGEYKPGDLAVYISVDSWVPHELAPFLSKGKEPREFNGVKGERLRTIKLRGQISQGLILPKPPAIWLMDVSESYDLTEYLGIQKWEKPIPVQLAGVCRSTFPAVCPKTDQERVQNLKKEIKEHIELGTKFEITEKLEGSSMTVLATMIEDLEYNQPIIDVHVCSRNMDLKLDQEGNAFVDTAKKTGLIDAITRYVGLGYGQIAVQGELIGPGIQDNIYGLKETEFHVFDIFRIDTHEYMTPFERVEAFKTLCNLGANIKHVHIISGNCTLYGIKDIQDILELAEGTSELADTEREGIVFKSLDGKFSFKAISNKYLLGEKE